MVKVIDLNEGDLVEEVFQVKDKRTYTSRNGNPYLSLRLADKTGEIEGRLWEGIEDWMKGLKRGDFLRVKGRVVEYMGQRQINVKEIALTLDVDIKEFLPSSERDIEEMVGGLRACLQQVKDQYLHKLLLSFFYDEEFMSLFKKATAAKELHHVYLGGLLEHTLGVTELCISVFDHFENLDRDLLIAGALLHDIGKVYEFTTERFIDYSTPGRLLGHIAIGLSLLNERMKEIEGFPEERGMLLKHIVLSHHGESEFGSPVVPKTVEALILYFMDDLDAKVNCFQSFIKREKKGEGEWTSYHRILERHLYKGMNRLPRLSEDWQKKEDQG